jgi:hypothetical protein
MPNDDDFSADAAPIGASTDDAPTGASTEIEQRALTNPVPRALDDWERFIKQKVSLNDMVETIHRKLVGAPLYVSYLDAVVDSQAVEGSLAADNFMAATMIRDRASDKNDGIPELARQKIATINTALGVVLRRYHMSRKERRNTVGGEVVPAPDNGE